MARARPCCNRSLADSAGLQAEALAELTAKDGVRILTWPDDVLAALKDAWGKVAKDEGDQDYFFRFVLDDIEKFTAKSSDQTQPSPGAAPQAVARADSRTLIAFPLVGGKAGMRVSW